jgi:hypothetical protein
MQAYVSMKVYLPTIALTSSISAVPASVLFPLSFSVVLCAGISLLCALKSTFGGYTEEFFEDCVDGPFVWSRGIRPGTAQRLDDKLNVSFPKRHFMFHRHPLYRVRKTPEGAHFCHYVDGDIVQI